MPMTQGQEWSNGDDAQVRNLAAVADDLLERAAAVPAGRAALTLVAGAGAPLKQTMLALRRGQHLADTRAGKDTEPPTKPSTGKVAGSSWRHCASTYSSGR
jgi:hypothetical protein